MPLLLRIQVGVAALAAALLVAAPASAGPPGKWTRITGGAAEPARNTDEPGLARTADGVLHVAYLASTPSLDTLAHKAISANAKTVTGPHQITQLRAINNRIALGRTQSGGLRVFFAGLGGAPGPVDGFMRTATADADGVSWTPWLPASATPNASPVYIAGGLDAAALPDGTPVVIWGDSSPGAAGTHVGLDPAVPDTPLRPGESRCCIGNPALALERQTGQMYAAWVNLTGGGRSIEVGPLGGAVQVAPDSRATQLQTRLGLTGHSGGGIYLAYVSGTNAFRGLPALWRVGDTRARVVRGQRGAQNVGVANAPGGRLWIFWTRNRRVYATRTNGDATEFGAIVSPRSPSNTTSLFRVVGEGSDGPLDVLGLFRRGGSDLGYWHQRLLPGLTLRATPSTVSAGKQVTFRVTDAGDPVKNAKVRLKLGGAVSEGTTASNGRVKLAVPAGTRRGRYTATATRSGYTRATVRVRVR